MRHMPSGTAIDETLAAMIEEEADLTAELAKKRHAETILCLGSIQIEQR